MRLALVCPYDWAAAGGVQVHVQQLAARLLDRGHDVVVLSPASGPVSQRWVRVVGRPIAVPYGDTRALVSPWPATRRRVRRALAAWRPDVVHVHEPFAPSATWFALRAGPPVVATFHSGLERSRLYDLAAPALRAAARAIFVRVAVSERAAEVARARLGGSFEIVPNGVDVERFARASPADLGPGPRLLFVGRLHRRKGFDVAVEVFRRLAAEREAIRLVVVGGGEGRAALDRLEPAARRRVAMLGALPNEALPPVYAACDVMLAPNTGGESFGVVLVEAMAAGLPVVASAIAGFDEVVRDEADGLLVRPRDAEAAAVAVARVLDDPALARRLSSAGRERARSYAWDVVVPALEALYERARSEGVARMAR